MATAGSAAPAGRTGDGNNADGLKTHISTALSGLLDRALGSRAEQGGAHGTPALPAVQKSELAREMHRLIMAPTPARLVLLKASERVAGVDAPEPYPYSCLYCNCGFEHMNTRNRHMGHAHKREMYGRSAMTEKLEDDPDDCEDSDHMLPRTPFGIAVSLPLCVTSHICAAAGSLKRHLGEGKYIREKNRK